MANRLPDLPPSNWSFWDGADKHSKEEQYKECNHFFIRKGWATECRKCHIGFLLNDPFYILDGKICLGDECVV